MSKGLSPSAAASYETLIAGGGPAVNARPVPITERGKQPPSGPWEE